MTSRISEESALLYPSVYNRKGLLGDCEVYVLEEDGSAYSLTGRVGPYTSVAEWFGGVGKDLLGHEPGYVLVAARRELPAEVLRISRGDLKRLESVAADVEAKREPF